MVVPRIKYRKLESAMPVIFFVPGRDDVLELVYGGIPVFKGYQPLKVCPAIISLAFFDSWPSVQ